MNIIEQKAQTQKPASFLITNGVAGFIEGLSVSFVLMAGLTRVIHTNTTIIWVLIAAACVGAITMAIGRYWVGRDELKHLNEALQKVKNSNEKEKIYSFYESLGFSEILIQQATEEALKDKAEWQSTVQAYEANLGNDALQKARSSAIVTGITYMSGSVLLALPFAFAVFNTALQTALVLAIILLLVLGYIKGKLTAAPAFLTSLRITVISTLAAGGAYWVARLFN